MDFYFVYSSGGGAGDWNGVNRMWNEFMPDYFKENLLIKFGDIFFNHKGINGLLRPRNWKNINNARDWLIQRTSDETLLSVDNILLDVGTTKIVNYIDSKNLDLTPIQIIEEFDRIVTEDQILEKYCKFILQSDIKNAVTFDIPNPFKIRNKNGKSIRNIFYDDECKTLLIDKCAKYANFTYNNIDSETRLMTILPAFLQGNEITEYLNRLKYTPTKLAIGALIDMDEKTFIDSILNINKKLDLESYSKVHFLGCGGIKKAQLLKSTLGNHSNFSVDNTTAFNRAIDGNTKGTKQSAYIDYADKNIHRIKPKSKDDILKLHYNTDISIKMFSDAEMEIIINSILEHQSSNSSVETYNNRAKLVMHNFHVFKHNSN